MTDDIPHRKPPSPLVAVTTAITMGFAALVLVGILVGSMIVIPSCIDSQRWSIAFHNESGATCTITLNVVDDGEEETLTFEKLLSQNSFEPTILLTRRGHGVLRSVQVVCGDKRIVREINEPLPKGTRISISLYEDFQLRTNIDNDYHM